MADLTVNNQRLDNTVLVKLRAGQTEAAQKAAKKNAADDVFFRINQDVYVASGRALSKDIKAGSEVRLNGEAGTVLAVNNEANTAKEGALRFFKPSAWGIGAAGAVGAGGGGFMGLILSGASGGAVASAVAGSAAAGAAFVAAPAAILAGAVSAGSAIHASRRDVDTESLKAFGDVLQ